MSVTYGESVVLSTSGVVYLCISCEHVFDCMFSGKSEKLGCLSRRYTRSEIDLTKANLAARAPEAWVAGAD